MHSVHYCKFQGAKYKGGTTPVHSVLRAYRKPSWSSARCGVCCIRHVVHSDERYAVWNVQSLYCLFADSWIKAAQRRKVPTDTCTLALLLCSLKNRPRREPNRANVTVTMSAPAHSLLLNGNGPSFK